jgi:serine/threonine protein kinase/Tol biopolymer transport system component
MTTRTISHYEILERLGEGGMGTVYRAVDVRLSRPVAVKLLRAELAVKGESRKRFVHEARAASALNHPNIATIYDIGQDSGVDFIAMEYVAGVSLAQLIVDSRLQIGDALKYATQIADALSTAHAAGIIHRDLKPANIMVSDKGAVKVVDFGLAKLSESPRSGPEEERASTDTVSADLSGHTEEGAILGTAAYMSPEQATGKPADARSDVFAFGVVLYEMVTGRRAFRGDTRISTLSAILEKEPESPREIVPGLPVELEKLIVRCLRKSPERRWQSMADLKVTLEELRESDSDRLAAPRPALRAWHGRRWLTAGVLVGAVLLLLGLAAWWQLSRLPPAPVQRPFLLRLTSDLSWTDNPAISLDGRFLAYASDRSGERNLDIWVQQIPDGSPVRLTRHGADNLEPSFSADGSRIAFQSTRPGGGIFLVPTLGGEERLLAAGGFGPRFSPDGAWIAYCVTTAGGGGIVVAPAAGGPPARVAENFHIARAHVWSPDGHYLLFWGQRERDAAAENNVDWYVVPVTGGQPVPSGARQALLRDGFEAFQGLPAPDAWVRDGNRIVFHGHVGDSWNMWQVAISPDTWQVRGTAQRATFGTTDEAAGSVTADGRMVFVSRTMGADIWSVPIDSEKGKALGAAKRVTQDAADDYDPTISDDGNILVFRSRRTGQFDVFVRNLKTNEETSLTQTTLDEHPVVSRDGKKVAYSSDNGGKTAIFVVPVHGGAPERMCSDCGEVEQWTPDGSALLYVTTEDPSGVGLLPLDSSPQRQWLKHPTYGIFNPRLSSDGRWLSFNARANRLAPARVLVAAVEGSRVADEKEWIEVSDDGEAPSWSPQAHLLYFWSNRDGSPCLWAQRLDATTKRPRGEPLLIQHFHSRGLSWKNLYLGAPDIAVARDKVVFNLGEHTGNIWMTKLPPNRD